jgi:hypothetical protein
VTGFAANRLVRRIENVTGCIVIKRQVLRRALPRLPERHPPLPQVHDGSSEQNNEKADNIFQKIIFLVN